MKWIIHSVVFFAGLFLLMQGTLGGLLLMAVGLLGFLLSWLESRPAAQSKTCSDNKAPSEPVRKSAAVPSEPVRQSAPVPSEPAPLSPAVQIDQEIRRLLGREIDKGYGFGTDYWNRVKKLYDSFNPELVSERLRKKFGFEPTVAPLFELENTLRHVFYHVPGSGSELWEEYRMDGRFACVHKTTFDKALQLIRKTEMPEEEKIRKTRALRELYPAKTYPLSGICTDREHPILPGWDPWQLDEDNQTRIADLLFGSDTDPLQDPSGDPAADRRKALHRIYTFLSSTCFRPNRPFSSDNVSANPGSFRYSYSRDEVPCYDGGCCDTDIEISNVCVIYHPPGKWDKLLLLRAASKDSSYPYPSEALSQGDCVCFNDSSRHLYLNNPFGIDGTLEIFRR